MIDPLFSCRPLLLSLGTTLEISLYPKKYLFVILAAVSVPVIRP